MCNPGWCGMGKQCGLVCWVMPASSPPPQSEFSLTVSVSAVVGLAYEGFRRSPMIVWVEVWGAK